MTEEAEVQLTASQKVIRECEAVWLGEGSTDAKRALVHILIEAYLESAKSPVEYKVPQ